MMKKQYFNPIFNLIRVDVNIDTITASVTAGNPTSIDLNDLINSNTNT